MRLVLLGAEQHNKANLEQGLNAAIYALDRLPGAHWKEAYEHTTQQAQKYPKKNIGVVSGPDGGAPNVAQASAFVRDNAYLAIVFVSDEDDCSIDDDKTLENEKVGRCTCEADTDEDPINGVLRPVAEAANRIKTLKTDPSRILVAAVIGDSTQAPEQVATDREDFIKSKCRECDNPALEHPLLFNTYICHADSGKADYGRRYVELVEMFGANGIMGNICSDNVLSNTLNQLLERLMQAVNTTTR